MTETKQGTRPGRKAPADKHADDTRQKAADEAAGGLRGRADQFGALLAKSLDLAEAGLGLGVTLVNRVGVAAQQQVFERFMTQASAAGAPATVAAPPTAETPPAPPAPPEAAAAESPGIGNRLPLQPGGAVKVSFSINNDSPETPKKVALRLEGFVGDAKGLRLDPAGFTLKPAKKTIAPMDFEKFVLEGVLPPQTPPDVYRGWVIVGSDTELRIPVWLAVVPA